MTHLIITEETTTTLPGSETSITFPPGYYQYDGTPGTLILPANQFIPREPDTTLYTDGLLLGILLFIVAAIAFRH